MKKIAIIAFAAAALASCSQQQQQQDPQVTETPAVKDCKK